MAPEPIAPAARVDAVAGEPPTAPGAVVVGGPSIGVDSGAEQAHQGDAFSQRGKDAWQVARREAAGTISSAVRSVASAAEKQGGLSAFEAAIGGRWYALIGAVIVLIGIGLFFKYALEQHWLTFSPVARCLAGGMVGLVFLAGGEWARRKLSRAASAGFSAVGVGTLIASVWAAHRLYGLTGPTLAFVLMAAACAVGVLVAARARLASVAVVAIIGAYANPFIVGDSGSAKAPLYAYLLMVLATGLVLPMWKGPRFAATRTISWWGTILLGGAAVVMSKIDAEPVAVLAFLVVAWLMIHAELTISAGRFGLVHLSTGVGSGETVAAAGITRDAAWLGMRRSASAFRAWRPIASSFSTTSWSAILTTMALGAFPNIPVWLAPAFFAALTLTGAHVLSGHLRFLTDVPENDSERLGAGFAVQAGALLIATVSMALSGGVLVLAWLAMGLAAITCGRWLRARALDIYGLIVLGIGTVRLVTYDVRVGGRATTEMFSLALGSWSLLACGAAAIWFVAAWLLLQESRVSRRLAALSACVAWTVLGLAFSMLGNFVPAVLVVWALAGAGSAITGMWTRSRVSAIHAAGVLSIASIVAVASSPVHAGAAWGIVVNGWTAAGWCVAAAWASLVIARWRDETQFGRIVRWAAASIGPAVAACMALVSDPVAPGSVMVLSLLGAGLAFASRARPLGILKYQAVVYLAVATLIPLAGGAWNASESTWAFLGLVLSPWTLSQGVAAVGWFCSFVALRKDPGRAGLGLIHVISAGIMAAIIEMPFNAGGSAAALSLAWLVIAMGGVAASIHTPWRQLVFPASACLVLPVLAWLSSYSPVNGGWPPEGAPSLLSAGLLTCIAIAGGTLVSASLLSRPCDEGVHRTAAKLVPAMCFLAIAFLWLGTSMEAGRIGEMVASQKTAQKASVSVWWGIYGLGLITGGFLWKRGLTRAGGMARKFGLALVGVAVAKTLLWDLVQVGQMARVVSFVGLGLLMIAVTVVYSKLSGTLLRRGPAESQNRDLGAEQTPSAADGETPLQTAPAGDNLTP